MKKHIIWIRLFASYYLLFGVLNFLLGIFGVLNGNFVGLSFIDSVVSIYAFGIAPFLLVVGIGLFMFKEWARKGFIILAIVKVLFTIGKSAYMYSMGDLLVQGMFFGIIFTGAIHGLMIFYFVNANVKNIFYEKSKGLK